MPLQVPSTSCSKPHTRIRCQDDLGAAKFYTQLMTSTVLVFVQVIVKTKEPHELFLVVHNGEKRASLGFVYSLQVVAKMMLELKHPRADVTLKGLDVTNTM